MADHETAVANEFLDLAAKSGKSLTQMQLQKLVYIAHGWSLAINNEPLTVDQPQAWDYGPVYPELWEALRKYGKSIVSDKIKVGDFGFGIFSEKSDDYVTANLTDKQSELISKVYDVYGGFHAFQLSTMTHQEGTPWHKIFVEECIKRGTILNDLIKEYFVDLARN